ncbi:MAG TPA: STAS domain-containing protein [Jatrophihabitans sp.]|jgi:stage II sporulation protein AA (anti-sigma F factor antagonist)
MPNSRAAGATGFTATPYASIDIAVPHDNTVLISAAGDFDLANVGLIRRRVAAASTMGRDMNIDMARVGFIDAVVLDALIELHGMLGNRGLRLQIANPSRPVARVLRLAGVLSMLADDSGSDPVPADHTVSVTTPMRSPSADIKA